MAITMLMRGSVALALAGLLTLPVASAADPPIPLDEMINVIHRLRENSTYSQRAAGILGGPPVCAPELTDRRLEKCDASRLVQTGKGSILTLSTHVIRTEDKIVGVALKLNGANQHLLRSLIERKLGQPEKQRHVESDQTSNDTTLDFMDEATWRQADGGLQWVLREDSIGGEALLVLVLANMKR